jgi:hypothetical protein
VVLARHEHPPLLGDADATATQCWLDSSHVKPGAHWLVDVHADRHAPNADSHAYGEHSNVAAVQVTQGRSCAEQNDGPIPVDGPVHWLG